MDGDGRCKFATPTLTHRYMTSSDGSVTVLHSGSVDVMRATFVHSSPYAYFDVLAGGDAVTHFMIRWWRKITPFTSKIIV